ncbi:hypothetical protein ABZ085_06125 [Streptomyces albidoflavus]
MRLQLSAPVFARAVSGHADLRKASRHLAGPTPGFAATLAYYDSPRAPRLPAALTQGQRDYFGAHTYHRTDRPGTFHTLWGGDRGPSGAATPARSRRRDAEAAGPWNLPLPVQPGMTAGQEGLRVRCGAWAPRPHRRSSS